MLPCAAMTQERLGAAAESGVEARRRVSPARPYAHVLRAATRLRDRRWKATSRTPLDHPASRLGLSCERWADVHRASAYDFARKSYCDHWERRQSRRLLRRFRLRVEPALAVSLASYAHQHRPTCPLCSQACSEAHWILEYSAGRKLTHRRTPPSWREEVQLRAGRVRSPAHGLDLGLCLTRLSQDATRIDSSK